MRTLITLLILCISLPQTSLAKQTPSFVLSKNCPASFMLTPDNTCRLVSRYQQYSSVQGRGVGGTKTSLPTPRDGFSPEQIDLGRFLFFDPILSADGSLSCASCHQPDKGYSDGLATSLGINNQTTNRSAPSLWNVAFIDKFFWDASAKTLEEQAMGPLFSPNEMGNTAAQLKASLQNNAIYTELFKQAFPRLAHIEISHIVTALAAFQSSLVSLNSRYDQYAHGYHQALNNDEIAGLNIFRSFVARCAECHQPPLFTNNQIAVIGVPEAEGKALDIGAQKTFNAAKLRGGFKVPTLRNIVKTQPYMHAGNIANLREAVEFYNKGRGHAVPDGETLNLHWHIWEPNLTDQELDLIVTFLGTLTDESLAPPPPQSVPSGLPVIDIRFSTERPTINKNTLSQEGE